MRLNNNQNAFFELLRAGLWEKDARVLPYGEIDFSAILKLAEEQSIVGLVAAGLEHIIDMKPAKRDVVPFIGRTVHFEQRNRSMNSFISNIVKKMRTSGICSVLVKGQGVAQYYERPLWRSAGDVDFILDSDNYQKAKGLLAPLAVRVDEEDNKRLHLGMTIEPWVVELHGSLRGGWSKKVDNLIDSVQDGMFRDMETRIWRCEETDVLLPSPDNDVIFVFTHILQHFFIEGIGLRQICDWCRLLYRCHDSLDVSLLDKRLYSVGLSSKWKAFAALAVNWLGMPVSCMPLYSSSGCWSRKAERILKLILDTGNFGQKRDKSYKDHTPFIKRLSISFGRHTKDSFYRLLVFPLDSLRVWIKTMGKGLLFALKGGSY